MKVTLEMESKDFRRFESIRAFAKLLQEAAKDDSQAEPAKAEPAKAEPAKAEPAKAEPAKAEPAKAEPNMLDLKKALKEYCVTTTGGAARVKAAMSKRGLTKASDATPEQLSEILKEVEA